MKVDDVKAVAQDTPHMGLGKARQMTRLILENKSAAILELGFRHGVSSCYIAAALDELGRGHLTTVDRVAARNLTPNIDGLLGQLGLSRYVTPFFEPSSYTWRLMKMLEETPQPRFDFCFIDGAHNWATDGFAFLLVDRMLAPGAMIVFDDLNWTYADSPTLRNSEMVRAMPEEERTCPQVRKIFELLVKTHPAYGEFHETKSWAIARKIG